MGVFANQDEWVDRGVTTIPDWCAMPSSSFALFCAVFPLVLNDYEMSDSRMQTKITCT